MVRSLRSASFSQSVVNSTSAWRPSVCTSIRSVVTSKFSLCSFDKRELQKLNTQVTEPSTAQLRQTKSEAFTCRRSLQTLSYSGCDRPVCLPFVVDHPDPGTLEHVFHLLWSGRGGEVHILWPLPRQQVPHSTSGYPQLKSVLLKELCQEKKV